MATEVSVEEETLALKTMREATSEDVLTLPMDLALEEVSEAEVWEAI